MTDRPNPDKSADMLYWEQDMSGHAATLIGGIVTATREKYAALSMLRSVAMISAEFDGEYGLYNRALVVAVCSAEMARVFGVYLNEEENPKVPQFCVRIASYDCNYNTMRSGRILFPTSFANELHKLLTDARQGIGHAPVQRAISPSRTPSRDSIYVFVEDDGLTLEVDYSTHSHESAVIEHLCDQCCVLAEQLVEQPNRLPDQSYGCKISFAPLMSSDKFFHVFNRQVES